MPTKNILIVGGAGYIGSHMVSALKQSGYQPVVLDNLVTGHRDAVQQAELIVGDMVDKNLLTTLFSQYQFAAVMHFASLIQVNESVQLPLKYYQNNVAATLNLLEAMLVHNVKKFIFSSSAAVYGEPQYTPIDEAHPLAPIHPYGRSKKMLEDIIKDLAHAHGLQYAILRYFNAAGADPEKKLGERHEPETHLIPLILQVAAGLRNHITVFGQDYPTNDGTCIRDYIHVQDLCVAHLKALEILLAENTNIICNLGTNQGYSVQEVIQIAREITNHDIPIQYAARRSGDPSILVANAVFAQQCLQWQPQFSNLKNIIQHAWKFCIAE